MREESGISGGIYGLACRYQKNAAWSPSNFDRSSNMKATLAITFFTCCLFIIASLPSMNDRLLLNPVAYAVMPISMIFIIYVISGLSGLLIQYSWLRVKVPFYYAIKFSSSVVFAIAMGNALGVAVESVVTLDDNGGTMLRMSFFITICAIICLSFASATARREKNIIFSENDLEEDDFISKEDEEAARVERVIEDDFPMVKKITISTLGNVFRAFIVVVVALYMITALATNFS